MDIVPILSTVILVATLITMIVALVAYAVFRYKEKRSGKGAPVDKSPAEEAEKETELDSEMITSVEQLKSQAKGAAPDKTGQKPPVPSRQPKTKKTIRPVKPTKQEIINEEEDEYEEEYEEEFEEEKEEHEEEQDFSPAQAAFMSSMEKAIGTSLKKKSSRVKPKSKQLKMRRFTVNKKGGAKRDKFDTDDEQTMWK